MIERAFLATFCIVVHAALLAPAEASDKCTASKLAALGKAEKGAISCHNKGLLDASYDEAACLAKKLGKLEKKLIKIGPGCSGTYATCEPRVLSCPAAVAAAGPSGATACEARKRKAASKYAAAALQCQASDTPADCTDIAEAKFIAALAKAEKKGACAGSADDLLAAIATYCTNTVAPPAGDPIPLCTGCADSSDCSEAEHCSGSLCVADVCTPDALACSDTELQQCGADGGSVETTVCESPSAGDGCVDAGGGDAWCACQDDWDCPAGHECVADRCVAGPEACDEPFLFAGVLPVAEIQWGGTGIANRDAAGAPFPASSQVSSTPLVANLDDDNGDGFINELDFPEIVFLSYCNSDISLNGVVRAIHGGGPSKGNDFFATCGSTVWHEGDSLALSCPCTNATANSTSVPAIGDLDGDGVPEIVVANENSGLTILSNTGNPITETGPNVWSSYATPAPALANLDNEGFAEIVVGRHAFTLGHDGNGDLVFVDKFSGSLMNGLQGLGPISCVADIQGDARLEIVAGTTVYAMPDPPSGVSTIAECAVGDMSDFCQGRLAVVWDGQTVNGAAAIPNAQRDGLCAVGDVLGTDPLLAPGPDNPLDGTAEVVIVAEGHLLILNGQTGALQRNVNFGLGTDGGAPVLDDFDGDGFPEIGVAFGTRYVAHDLQDVSAACPAWPNAFVDTASGLQGNPARAPGATCAGDDECAEGAVCARGNCVCLHNGWLRVTEDDSSRVTASAAFDFNGDGVREIAYNDECHLRVYDGRNGAVYFKNNSPSRTRIESPTIADADNDGSAEILVPSNNDSSSCSEGNDHPNGVGVWGALLQEWFPTRRIWNQHAYGVTNVTESAAIPAPAPNGQTDYNGRTYDAFRSNPGTCSISVQP
ncbi:MAG TPA: VCBS repeat-containing protein [Candidatus Limnocylindrales bacterium]|nr:VCBS repeat-containing protein [Candidatus Limnocylindrales bacterium]